MAAFAPPSFLLGLWRRARVTLRGRAVVVRGACLLCGKCCRGIHLLVDGAFVASERRFRRIREESPEYRNFDISGRSPSGRLLFTCRLLGPDNLCRDYDARPGFCRDYPPPGLYLQGLDMPGDCGFRFEEAMDFAACLADTLRAAPPGEAGAEDSGDEDASELPK